MTVQNIKPNGFKIKQINELVQQAVIESIFSSRCLQPY